jgi:V/A-type H+-transporting ATPase subunit C
VLVVDEVRLTRDALRYGFAVGKVKVLETRAFDPAAYERLLDAPTFAEQKRLLSETSYGRFLEHAETVEDVERGLDDALERAYAFLDEAALPEAVTRYFRLRYDFANFKAVAKARLLGVADDDLRVAHGTLDPALFSGELAELPEPFGALAAELDIATVDLAVDRAMFAELLKTAEKSKSRFLVELARLEIDLANLKTLVRARRTGTDPAAVVALFAEGGAVPLKTFADLAELEPDAIAPALGRVAALRSLASVALNDTAMLDANLDAVAMAALRGGRMGQVGPEPVIAYVFERESEVAVLRVLLLGKLTGIDDATLRRHVGGKG